MAMFDLQHPWVLILGVLGNIISIFVYFAPLPTFIQIYRRKSTLGFQSVPYVVALFSAMLWMYYASLKTDTVLLVTVNSVGCIIETIYIATFFIYASKEARGHTVKQIACMNVGLFSLIYFLTLCLAKGSNRVVIVGWICVAVSVSVFAAPLSIVFQVVRTRSIDQFMPFTLSFCLTISATMWFAYGLLQRDLCVALPNVFGFILGLLQMLLYGMYRGNGKEVVVVVVDDEMEKKLPAEHIINIVMIGSSEVYPVISSSAQTSSSEDDEKKKKTNNEKQTDDTTTSSSSSRSPNHDHHDYSAQKVKDQELHSPPPPPVTAVVCTAG